MSLETTIAVFSHTAIQNDHIDMYLEILQEYGFLVVSQKYTHEFSIKTIEALTATADGDSTTTTTAAAATASVVVQPAHAPSAEAPVVLVLQLQRVNAIATLLELIADHTFNNTYGSATPYTVLRDIQAYFPVVTQSSLVERTLVLLKPQYTQQQYKQLIDTLNHHKYVILAKHANILTAEQAAHISGNSSSNHSHSAEIEYLCSDVSVVILLERTNAIIDIQLLSGPVSPAEAQQYAPASLRALYGTDDIHNGVYVSNTYDSALFDIRLFIQQSLPLERTLGIVLPHALDNVATITATLKQNGFTIVSSQTLTLSQHRAETILAASKHDIEKFTAQVKQWSSGPVLVLLLEKVAAIDTLNKLAIEHVYSNAHATTAEVQREIHEFFPHIPSQQLPTTDTLHAMLNSKSIGVSSTSTSNSKSTAVVSSSLSEVLVNGLTALCRVRPTSTDDAILWLADWLAANNPNKPNIKHTKQTAAVQPQQQQQQQSLSAAFKQSVVLSTADTEDDSDDNEDSSSAATVSSNSSKRVVWLAGAPHSNQREAASRAAASANYEHIDVSLMLKAAITNSTSHEQSSIIKQHIATHRLVPTEIVVSLLKAALAATTHRRVLISSFPYNLDQALQAEKIVGRPVHLLALDLSFDDAAQRASAIATQQQVSVDKQLLKQKFSIYTDDITPVVQHYTTFAMATVVHAGGSAAASAETVHAAVTAALT